MKYLTVLLLLLCQVTTGAELPLKFIKENCQKCHNPKKHKGGVDFTKFKTAEDFWKNSKTWKTSIELVETGEMPPKKDLTKEQIEYFSSSVFKVLASDNFKLEDWFGRQVLRRLSPVEIENSLSDISGMKLDIAKNFPLDSGGGEGFSNNADTMRLTPVFFEKLSIAAEKFASHAVYNPAKGIIFDSKLIRPLTNEQFYNDAKASHKDFYNSRSSAMIRHEHRQYAEKYLDALCDLILRQRKTDFASIQKISKERDLVAGAMWLWVDFLKDTEAAIKKRQRMSYWARWAFTPFNKALKGKVSDPEAVKKVAQKTKHRVRFFYNSHSQIFNKFRDKKIKVNGTDDFRITVGPMHDGNEHDFVNLENAYFELNGGKKVYLHTLKPLKIKGQVHIGKNGKGEKAATLNGGKEMKNVVGFKAPAQVFFALPKGAKTFRYKAHMDKASSGKAFVQILTDQKKDMELVTGFVSEGVPFAGPGPRGAALRGEVDNFSLYMQYRFYPTDNYIDMVLSDKEKVHVRNLKTTVDWAWQLNNYSWRAYARKYKLKEVPAETEAAKLKGKAGNAFKKHRDNVNYFKGRIKKEVSKAIADFGLKLFRKPLSSKELDRWQSLFNSEYAKNGNLQQTIQDLIVSMVLHPSYIYRLESKEKGNVNSYELATRLSFFLWASTPDRDLLQLAEENKLAEKKILSSQIDRMLKDSKARRLSSEFFTSWLHTGKIYKDKIPNKEIFPEYNHKLRDLMVREVNEFTSALVYDDQPIDSLISADYSYINEELAKHYGIKNVAGEKFRKVNLKEANRGGILGMAAIHVTSSYPERTSPVLRGQWILETLIGAPVPPPPEEVEIEEAVLSNKKMTIKEKLAKHREVQSCAICHDRIDPLGFSMENFDAIGRWRTQDNGKPVDSEGELKSGKKLHGVEGLKMHLSTKGKEDFIVHFTSKLLGYGLGRGLDYPDKAVIRHAVARAAEKENRFSELVKGLIISPAFLKK